MCWGCVWGCVGDVLGMSGGCFGDLLGVSSGCVGGISCCFGDDLDMI